MKRISIMLSIVCMAFSYSITGTATETTSVAPALITQADNTAVLNKKCDTLEDIGVTQAPALVDPFGDLVLEKNSSTIAQWNCSGPSVIMCMGGTLHRYYYYTGCTEDLGIPC